jgi:hypothetical protein
MGYRLQINTSKLNQEEKARLIRALSVKLGLESKLMKDGRTLEIYDLPQ